MRPLVLGAAALGAVSSIWIFLTGYGGGSPAGLLVQGAFGWWYAGVGLAIVIAAARYRGSDRNVVYALGAIASAWVAFLLAGPAIAILFLLVVPRGV
jgi:hypothetical protein